MAKSSRPAFMFYPADWRKDPGLQACSLAARGLWADMLCIMHEGDPYGHLVINGKAVSVAQVARLVGDTLPIVKRLLAELEDNDVFSRTDGGVIYSRRMVKDEKTRNARAVGGEKSQGHPDVPPRKPPKDTQKDTTKDGYKDTPKDTLDPSLDPSLGVPLEPSKGGPLGGPSSHVRPRSRSGAPASFSFSVSVKDLKPVQSSLEQPSPARGGGMERVVVPTFARAPP